MQSQTPTTDEPRALALTKRLGAPVGLIMAALITAAWVGVWKMHLRLEMAMAISIGAMLLLAILLALREFPLRSGRSTPPVRTTVPVAAVAPASAPGSRRWSLDVLDAMDAKHFAALCETWFSWAGFDARTEPHRGDEGVDIWLHAARLAGPVAIVRCRHLRNQPVDLREMQEFFGLVSAHKSAHGTYTTTSTYTAEALQFAQERGIDAVDGRGLLRRIQTRTRQSQQALLAVAFRGASV